MENLLGTSLPAFIGVTVVILGGAAFLTGQAIAGTWRPVRQTVAYCMLLAAVSRFFIFALFEGELLSPTGYVIDAAVLVAIGLLAHRVTQVRKVTAQYPWQYERSGLLSYRERQVPRSM